MTKIVVISIMMTNMIKQLPGVDCAWVHPPTKEKYSLLVKFDKVILSQISCLSNLDSPDYLYHLGHVGHQFVHHPIPASSLFKDRVPAKRFFHPLGFHAWDKLNNQYQGMD